MGENNNKSGAGWLIIIVFIVLGVIAYALIYDYLKGEEEIVPTEPFETVENGDGLSQTGTRDYDIDDERNIEENGITEVNIETVSSEANVYITDAEAIKVHFYGDVSTSGEPPKMVVTTTGSRLNIVIEHQKSLFTGFRSIDTTLDVFIPEMYYNDIRVVTVSGNVDLDPIESKYFKAETTSGNITAESILCDESRISTVSGYIKIDGMSAAESSLSSTSGNIKVEDLMGKLSGSSVSGSLDFKFQTLEDDVDIETTSGDVTLSFPADSDFQVELRTTSGNFFVDFPIRMTGNGNNRYMKGNVGSAKHKVKVETTSGDIRIEQD